MAFAAGFCVNMLGVDFTIKHTTQQHSMGLQVYDNKGRRWIYITAGGTIAVFSLVKAANADDPYTSAVIATASNAATAVMGMNTLALSSGDYAWIVRAGVVEDDAVVVSSAVAAGDPIIASSAGACTIAVETDINNAIGICLVDDTDNTGTVLLFGMG